MGQSENLKMDKYIAIKTPSLSLSKIEKEYETHGAVYCIWPIGGRDCIVGQSLKYMCEWLNKNGTTLTLSSLYRVINHGQAYHRGWDVEKYSRDELEKLNSKLEQFEHITFVTKNPDIWHIDQRRVH